MPHRCIGNRATLVRHDRTDGTCSDLSIMKDRTKSCLTDDGTAWRTVIHIGRARQRDRTTPYMELPDGTVASIEVGPGLHVPVVGELTFILDMNTMSTPRDH